VSSQTRHELPSPPFPELHSVIESGTSDPPSVRRKGYVIDLLLVTGEPCERFLGGGSTREGGGGLVGPEEEGVVVGAGDQGFGVIRSMVLVPGEGKGSGCKSGQL